MNRLSRWKNHSLRQLGWLALLGISLYASPTWGLDIPPLTDRIVDGAQVLSSSDHSRLLSLLAAHEAKTTNQVAVLTLPSLDGEPLEEFTHRVASSWGLGQKGTDNGVLLLVAIQERKIRIEVGYGLEGTLTDARSSQIIRHEIVPRFRQGNYSEGILAGTQAIVHTIEGTYTAPEPSATQSPEKSGLWQTFGLAVVLGTLVGLFLGSQASTPGQRDWDATFVFCRISCSALVRNPRGSRVLSPDQPIQYCRRFVDSRSTREWFPNGMARTFLADGWHGWVRRRRVWWWIWWRRRQLWWGRCLREMVIRNDLF